jgi:2-oxoglutarate dehydrogenase E2 component (dihydrolipoamide succinyltransferase)
MSVDIKVPSLGESVTEATIARWYKSIGDSVSIDEPLLELETDKVTLEVPAPASGQLTDIKVKDGDTVEVGAILGAIAEGAAAVDRKKT